MMKCRNIIKKYKTKHIYITEEQYRSVILIHKMADSSCNNNDDNVNQTMNNKLKADSFSYLISSEFSCQHRNSRQFIYMGR